MSAMRRRLAAVAVLLTASTASAQVTRGVSWGLTAAPTGGASELSSISRDGRWVVFESDATNLVADDANGVRDVFLLDRMTGALSLISRVPGGAPGNAASFAPSISGDGAVVAFASDATNLGGGGGASSVYLFDRGASQLSRVPLAVGERADTRDILRRFFSLSADAGLVAFAVYTPAATTSPYVVVFTRSQGTMTRFPSSGSHPSSPRLNAAGNLLVAAHVAGGVRRVRVFDLTNSTVQDLVPPAGGACGYPSISDSGQWVAYECRGVPDPVAANVGLTRVYLHDRSSNTAVEVSAPPPGATRNHSLAPELSADGRFLSFTSFTRLVPAVTGDRGQVYRFDRTTGGLEVMSRDLSGVPLPAGAYGAAGDAAGTVLAVSTPQPVDVSDTNARDDVYLVDPTCTYSVTPSNVVFPPGGGQRSLTVTTGAGCLWASGAGTGFFSVGLPRGGAGSGTATLTASTNASGSVRAASLSIAGQVVAVSQSAAVAPAFSLQPADVSVSAGATATFTVAATGDPIPTFQWQMSSDGVAWGGVPPTAPYAGTTSSQLTIQGVPAVPSWNRFRAVASNTAGAATSAPALLTVVAGCAYTTVTGELMLPPAGGTGFIELGTGPSCVWTASAAESWLSVTPANGVGSTRVTYAAGANTSGAPRSATMTIAGRTNVVRQAAVSSSLTITTATLPAAAVGVAYAADLAATGGTGTIVWSLNGGALPGGFSLSAAGVIDGTAAAPGTATFTIRATDAVNTTATRTLSIVVGASSAPVLAPAVVNRPNLTLSWTPPAAGPAPTGYTIVASLAAGGPVVAQIPLGTQTSITVAGAPDGTFFIRVLATVNEATVSSNEIRVDIAPPALPAAPQNLTATVAGSVITFAWQPPAGSPVTGYHLEAGTAPGLANLATLPMGTATSFVTPPVPNGDYYVRVRAENAAGIGPASTEVRAVVGPPPPGPPALTGSSGPGGTVSLSWSVPTSGAPVTGYELHAGTAPGLSNIVVIALPGSQTALATGGVPPGTYYLRVVARSASGPGAFSNQVALVVN